MKKKIKKICEESAKIRKAISEMAKSGASELKKASPQVNVSPKPKVNYERS